MQWYQLHIYRDRLEAVEQFFVEIAANEEQLLTYGFKRAFSFATAKAAMEALSTFSEDFSSCKRYALRMDRSLGQELEHLDAHGKLVEQVALIALRLRMTELRRPLSLGLSTINQFLLYLPYASRLVKSKGLFSEEAVSLSKTIINLGRLRGIVAILLEHMSQREASDDEVFKPSNIKPDRVIDLIDAALIEVEHLTSISPSERARIEGYLQEAKKEALVSSPSWSKIVGALVIVAAITSGMADAPNAAKNLKDAIEYILGTSVEKPLQRYLPPPPEERQEEPSAIGVIV